MNLITLRVRSLVNKLAVRLIKISDNLQDSSRRLAIKTEGMEVANRRALQAKWYKDNGDQTLRVNYSLNLQSIVFDVGGYHGDWAQDIYCLYGSEIHIFEPVPQFVEIIKSKFGNNEAVHIHQFGLADKNTSTKIYLSEGGTSTIQEAEESIKIKLVKAWDFLKKNNIKHIDLLKINIEGGEYDLLNHLIEADFTKNITDIQVQFHNFVPDAEKRMKSIQKKLSETHQLTYQYPWVWDNWRLKKE